MSKEDDAFFPKGKDKIPSTSNYFKFKEGDNKFRILSSTIVGYEYWNKDNKPVRSREPFDETPDIKLEKYKQTGDLVPTRVNYFWAFVVWNYEDKRVQVLQLTQKGIMEYIQALVKNDKWGNPKGYDLVVNRKGSGFDTEYTTVADPHSPVSKEAEDALKNKKVNLDALYEVKDPFAL